MQEKAYIVTRRRWVDTFTRSELDYLIGVFTDEDTAKKVAEKHKAKITEIELNKAFPLKGNELVEYLNQQESCNDCISREQALSTLYNLFNYTPQYMTRKFKAECMSKIKYLPSVTPTKSGYVEE